MRGKETEPPARREPPRAVVRVAPPWAPRWLLRVAAFLGAAYLAAIWLDAAGSRLPDHLLARPLLFFVQVAELFPHAAQEAIEWRARGWRCDLGRFEEVDVRPFFPIRRDDKESRFYRAMFFHFRQHQVMEVMDDYITRQQNRLHPEARIGGVMLLSLRIPIPPVGHPEARYQRRPLDDYPPSVTRKYWYVTPAKTREARCAEGAP
jgi:hypothetical protein